MRPNSHPMQKILPVLAILVLAAAPPTGAQAEAVRSPSAGTFTTPYIEVVPPKERICVGRTYDLTVRTRVDKDVSMGNGVVKHISAEVVSGVAVQGSVEDGSVGALSPQKLVTGFVLDDEPGSATFSFQAKKAGNTTLTFKAKYRGQSIQEKQAITVVTCAYTVGMNVIDVAAEGGIVLWTMGNLSTQITGSGGELTGGGDFLFTSGFVGPPCTISFSDIHNPTSITGTIDDKDQLVLEFKYQPSTSSDTASCPLVGSASGSYAVDLTKTGIASATFPATGGTRSMTWKYPGDMPPGTMVIDVEPVSAQAGG